MSTPKKMAKNVGRPDMLELEQQNRIQHSQTRGFDSEPNPTVILKNGESVNMGHVLGPSGMRKGLTPEKYHAMVELSLKRRSMGKEWDFLPQLTDDESAVYQKWLAGQKK